METSKKIMKILKPDNVYNRRYYFIGAILIILNRIRHFFTGYKTPRSFSNTQISQSVEYDLRVVKQWIKHLHNYSKEQNPLKNKVVLELCPGPDLGTGFILLALGVKKYLALDTNDLLTPASLNLYKKLFIRLKKEYPDTEIDNLKNQMNKYEKGENSAIRYFVDKGFDISKINDKVDIVFSQASFEHFSNVEKTIKDLNKVTNPGGILISEIDLKTHTRWIRDKDPLNIYRYNNFFWSLFKFKGSPNRIRPFEYKKFLEKNGWSNTKIDPLSVLDKKYLDKVKPTLNRKYKNLKSSDMKMLSIMIMSEKN